MRLKINFLVCTQECLLAIAKKRKLAWFEHVTRRDSLSTFIFQDTIDGWAAPWSVEEMLDGQRQRVEIPAHARTAHQGLPQKKTGRGSLLYRPSCPLNDPVSQKTGLNLPLLALSFFRSCGSWAMYLKILPPPPSPRPYQPFPS